MNHPAQLIPFFDLTRDWRKDPPTRLMPIEEARALKDAGRHFFLPGGRGLVELSQTSLEMAEKPAERDVDGKPKKERSRWAIIGQTGKPGVRHKETREGPGFPRYAFV